MTQLPAAPLAAPWLEVLNPGVILGQARYALFDFDGTLSVIRRGWEQVMIAVMLECICAQTPPTPEIAAEVAQYVDQSTGILSIKQMQWLEAAVQRHGLARSRLSATEYKRLYTQRLLQPVSARLAQLDAYPDGRDAGQDAWMIAGARQFLHALARRGVSLFLASGSDQEFVLHEAGLLGIADLFEGRIYGAQGVSEDDSKERIIQQIIAGLRCEQGQAGARLASGSERSSLWVIGDGPVEMRYARAAGAVALGIAADEKQRAGLDQRKRQRLIDAGADLLVTDFLHATELADLATGCV